VVKAIAEELRGLAVEWNIPIVSATQLTRQGFCLDLESKIITKTGIKSLKDIQIGDEVLSSNKQYNSVKTIFPIKKKKMYKITTESGKEIICSEEHFFPTKDGIEKNLQNSLSINDELFVL
jgi:intein/homing endonuclease